MKRLPKVSSLIFASLLVVPAFGQSPKGVVPISPAQLLTLQAALQYKSKNSELQGAVEEATAVIESFLKVSSCLAGQYASPLNVFAAPGHSYNYIVGPLPVMFKHDKSSCVNVIRVHGWITPTKNSHKFEVVYQAEDSGESSKGTHEVVKQPSGEWLFTR